MKTLGIDYGEKKVGLAISEGEFAAPFKIETNTRDLSEKICRLCQKEGVTKIVVGVSEGRMAQSQKEFGQNLAQAGGLPVEFWDETLTSKEAVQKMIEAGAKQKKRRQEDAVAAALILQSYLEGRK